MRLTSVARFGPGGMILLVFERRLAEVKARLAKLDAEGASG
jgi:hypothetical protein